MTGSRGPRTQPASAGKTQMAFELAAPVGYTRADFFAAAGNAAALGWVERWPAWPGPVLVVHGPPGAGKTHLAHLWRDRANAGLFAGAALTAIDLGAILGQRQPRLVIDDAEDAADAALLHVFNAVVASEGWLLLTARKPPPLWRPRLADLDSRLRAVSAVGIELPDDRLLGAVLAKHFADRQLRVAPAVIDYLLRHMERSLAAAAIVAAALDRAALRAGGAVTARLAAKVLGDVAAQSSQSEEGVA